MLATLGESLGWHFGAVWRPDGAQLRCASLWQSAGARPGVSEFAAVTHARSYAAGQGLAGRVWAFRRPVWSRDLSGEAVRAGLVTAAAFPITLGDECVGVIELYAGEVREPNGEVSALFATVGGQLASYLARRRVRARARRSFDGAEALIVALDEHGRVEIANGTACRPSGSRSATCWAATGSPSPCPSPSVPPRARPYAPAGGRGQRARRHPRRAVALVTLARRRRHADRRARVG